MGKSNLVSVDKAGKSVAVTVRFNPERILTWFFVIVLVVAFGVMAFSMFSVLHRATSDAFEDVDTSLLTTYMDEALNCLYFIPGSTWEMAEMDSTELQEVVEESKVGGSFSLRLQPLKKEVLSLLCFNESGDSGEGYRQFLTFSFRALPEEVNPAQFGAYVDSSSTSDFQVWLDYCEASFIQDMKIAGFEAELTDIQILSDNYGVLMHTVVYEEVTKSDGSIGTEPLYYTQFIYPISSMNIGIATFGSIFEDTSVDNYLAYMLSKGTYY